MNTEDHARKLIEKFQIYFPLMLHKEKTNPKVKECALKAVDEIENFMCMDDEYNEDCHMANTHWVRYWHEVKEWWKELKNRESKVGGNKNKDDDEMEEEEFDESAQQEYINWGDALSDQHINWFR